jgi:hypothetical protein
MESLSKPQPQSLNLVTELSLNTHSKTKRDVAQQKLKSSAALPKISDRIPRRWSGGCAVLLGGGPSLDDYQCQAVEKYHQRSECYVLGVNDAYRLGHVTLDALYAADTKWWKHHITAVREVHDFPLFTQCATAAAEHDLWHIPGNRKPSAGATEEGLCTEPSAINFGDNSGYQAINLAYHLGVTNIILLGYDFTSPGVHWFGEHPKGMNVKSNFQAWVPKMRPLADDLQSLGVRVMNSSPGSALDCFPQEPIDTALRWLWRPCYDQLEWPDGDSP